MSYIYLSKPFQLQGALICHADPLTMQGQHLGLDTAQGQPPKPRFRLAVALKPPEGNPGRLWA
jgi:hypothetical protein